MYDHVQTAWNFLNSWAHDQDQLLSHGEARLQQWPPPSPVVNEVRTPGIRCVRRRSVVILDEAWTDDED